MYSVWTKHLKNTEAKERFENSILGSKSVLDRAVEILKESEVELDREETSTKTYDKPNWDYRQAHLNGLKQGLRIAQKLLTLDQGN